LLGHAVPGSVQDEVPDVIEVFASPLSVLGDPQGHVDAEVISKARNVLQDERFGPRREDNVKEAVIELVPIRIPRTSALVVLLGQRASLLCPADPGETLAGWATHNELRGTGEALEQVRRVNAGYVAPGVGAAGRAT